jgi:hypothetical protein
MRCAVSTILRYFAEDRDPNEVEELQEPVADVLEENGADLDQVGNLAAIFSAAVPHIQELDELRDQQNPNEVWEIASRQEFAVVQDWVCGMERDELRLILADYPKIVGTRIEFHFVPFLRTAELYAEERKAAIAAGQAVEW